MLDVAGGSSGVSLREEIWARELGISFERELARLGLGGLGEGEGEGTSSRMAFSRPSESQRPSLN
jgi:hypothetical protein